MLSASAAWAIATAFLAPLQGSVRLVTDRDDGPAHSIVESYAWVRIAPPARRHAWLTPTNDPQEEAKERAAVVRAAMTAWTWLSSCTGYSGRANPAFWKRVFSAFQESTCPSRSAASHHRPAPAVTDAIAFFDQPGHEFPRFMVSVNDLFYREPDGVDTRQIFGLVRDADGALTPRVAALVARVRSLMEPFVDRQVVGQRDVDVCITVDTFLMSAVYQRSPYTALTTLIQDVNNAHSRNDPQSLRLQIVQFLEDSAAAMGSTIHQEGFAHFVRSVSVRYSHFALHQPLRDLTTLDSAQWTTSLFRLDGGSAVQAQVSSLSFLRHAIDDVMAAGLFSALPFARSVRSLAFDTLSASRRGAVRRRDLAWLAYALFHPHAKASSCRHIEWQHAQLTEEFEAVLHGMARGNNLLAVVHGTLPRSDAYYSGTLETGTSIRLEPTFTSEVLLQVSSPTTRVDVCDVSSLDSSTWTEWVGVIVPGYGLGWVQSRQLQNVRADASSVGSLSGLTLHSGGGYGQPDLKVMVQVLALLGGGLTYLNVESYAEVDTATLQGILGACQSLKVLTVRYGGEPWHQSVAIPVHCQLHELDVIVPDDVRAIHILESASLKASLKCLRAVRITANRNELLAASGPVLQLLIAKAPSLRYLHWRNTLSTSASTTMPYTASQVRTQAILGDLQLLKHVHLPTQGTATPSAAAAILSVARARGHATDSALASVVNNRDLLRTILQFATNSTLRTICLESDEIKTPNYSGELTWCEWLKTSLRGMLKAHELGLV